MNAFSIVEQVHVVEDRSIYRGLRYLFSQPSKNK